MDLSITHLILILLVVLLVFGAGKIPEVGRSLGQGIREFKRSMKDAAEETPKVETTATKKSKKV